MANSFEEAREANRRAQATLTARDRAKAGAATRDPQRDTFSETAARVKNTGGPWTPGHGDTTFGSNSKANR